MTRLTILVGAGAMVEVSSVSTSSITNELLSSNKINTSSIELFSKIYSDLLISNTKWSNYKPNFEDIFHGLEILDTLYTRDDAAPEFKPIHKIFTNLNDDYKQFKPFNNLGQPNSTLSLAISDLLKTIADNIEIYSKNPVETWYQEFFINLSEKYNLDIFNLNYDTWFETIFKNNYNDGFINSNTNSDYLEFSPREALNVNKHEININHLHGQLDFTFINPATAKKDFNDDNFYTIYKVKNRNNTSINRVGSSFQNTQGGEHLKNTTIITGKYKTEKIALSPFDTYRANFQNCIMNNSNLLIIGYGFADYYINNVLNQFYKVHKDNINVNVIDFADEDKWNKSVKNFNLNIISETKIRTLCGIFGDNTLGDMLKQNFVSPQKFNGGIKHLYLRGFQDAAKNNVANIINSYKENN